MLSIDSIANLFSNKQFKCKSFEVNDETDETIVIIDSSQRSSDIRCPKCGSRVHVHDHPEIRLKDMPFDPDSSQEIIVRTHRYQCQSCKHSFNEEIGFKYPGTRVTRRAAAWIKAFLRHGMTITAVSELIGIHWETISRIHKEVMEEELAKRAEKLLSRNYKPKRLAVDEFAIHKGHTYATCVMDIDEGDVLWIGKGRSIADFSKFFEEIDMEYLSEVEAVAMDMNASYNRLVEQELPHAAIVYDRYHMQAQFGKDVIGSVRLEEARRHQHEAKEIEARITDGMSKAEIREIKDQAKEERRLYRKLKKSRWTLLRNSSNLSEDSAENLEKILEEHHDLAVCYAMKEEMCDLFDLRDPEIAEYMWESWFKAAKESKIPQLVKFARLKEKRIKGLIAHAEHPISTGKLEGFNNKIKVAKRIGYGYRNDEYFFTLVRYSALPSVKCRNVKKKHLKH